MIDTVLFDLDGTLLPMKQDEFIKAYLKELGCKLALLGYDAELMLTAVLAGTKTMISNNGSAKNHVVFWKEFNSSLGNIYDDTGITEIEALCDRFYKEEFNRIQGIIPQTELPKKIIQVLRDKHYDLVLATNPLFPPEAVESRLNWIGLSPDDFRYITHYKNSSYCKPHQDYYRHIITAIDKLPEQVMMVGNNVVEDLAAHKLGLEVYLVTDHLENEAGLDISEFKYGTLEDFCKLAESFGDASPDRP